MTTINRMFRLRLQILGGFHLCSAGERPLVLPGKKVQALLAYLAIQPDRPQARGKLSGLLWADSSDSQARASLRQALLVLRKSLALTDDELVAGAGETITLRSQCIWVDALDFERLIDDGSVDALERGTSLYAGELLEALETRAPAFDDWLAVRRQQFRERSLEAMNRVLDYHLNSGSVERAVETELRLLALTPFKKDCIAP